MILAQSFFSSPAQIAAYLLLSVGLGTVIWAPLAISRRFRSLRCAGSVVGITAAVLGLLLASAPDRARATEPPNAPQLPAPVAASRHAPRAADPAPAQAIRASARGPVTATVTASAGPRPNPNDARRAAADSDASAPRSGDSGSVLPVESSPPAAPAGDAAPAPARPTPAPSTASDRSGVNPSADAPAPLGIPAMPASARDATTGALPTRAAAPSAPNTQASPSAPALQAEQGDPGLSSPITDANNRFAIALPKGWRVGSIQGHPWSLEASDNGTAFIDVGSQPIPSAPTAIGIFHAAARKHLSTQPGVIVHASGQGTLQGRPYVWIKYTGPMPMTTGAPVMTMVHYIVPLEDRAIEIRMAATPDTFVTVEPIMSRSIRSFTLQQSSTDPGR